MERYVKLIVAGSRTITARQFIYTVIEEHLDHFNSCNILQDVETYKDLIIVSGCAKGVDSIALDWAKEHNVKYEEYPAQWINERGIKDLSAGFKRNKKMALNSTHLLAIWDMKSRGTAHMIDMMNALDKPTYIVEYLKEYDE